MYQRHKMDEQLLHFIEDGVMMKKGVKGDPGERLDAYHQEL